MQIEFINHASVLISEGDVALLTDPWYSGPAFHKGWKLLAETPEAEVDRLLDRVTHIWLSHEHPDHFSVGFFKTHGAKLRAAASRSGSRRSATSGWPTSSAGRGSPCTRCALARPMTSAAWS